MIAVPGNDLVRPDPERPDDLSRAFFQVIGATAVPPSVTIVTGVAGQEALAVFASPHEARALAQALEQAAALAEQLEALRLQSPGGDS